MLKFRKNKKHATEPTVDISTYHIYEDVITEYQWLHRQYRQIATRAVEKLENLPSCDCEDTLPMHGICCETCQIIEDYDRLTRYDK